MWDEDVVPSSSYTGDSCLALPKLNMQFLSFRDYLLRTYNLYSLEATHDIRDALEEVVRVRRRRLGAQPRLGVGGLDGRRRDAHVHVHAHAAPGDDQEGLAVGADRGEHGAAVLELRDLLRELELLAGVERRRRQRHLRGHPQRRARCR